MTDRHTEFWTSPSHSCFPISILAVPKTTTCPRLFYLQAYFFAIVVIIKLFYFHCDRPNWQTDRQTEERVTIRPSVHYQATYRQPRYEWPEKRHTLCSSAVVIHQRKDVAINNGDDWGLFVVAWARFTAFQSFRLFVPVVPSGGHIHRICLWKTCKRSFGLRSLNNKKCGSQTVAGVNGFDNRTPLTDSNAAASRSLNKWHWWQWVTLR